MRLLFLIALPLAAQPVITPSISPVVRQGSTYQFTATGSGTVTWSLAAGSAGSINATGLYTAPPTVRHNNVIRGCPAFANDHIYNVRIDGIAKSGTSDSWASAVASQKLTFGTKYAGGDNGFSVNVGNNSTPTQALLFYYTPENNGNFMYVPMPYRKKESGAGPHVSTSAAVDRHMITLNRDTCELQELYADYPAGQNAYCPTCTAQGGVKANLLSYGLGHGVDAAGQFIQPLTARYSEFKAGAIKHAMRAAVSNMFLSGSCGDATYVWPATSEACVGTGGTHIFRYGTRARLKASFNISGYGPSAQIILRALQQYGLFLVDGGGGGEFNIMFDNDTGYDAAINQAMYELFAAGIKADNLEFIDESPFMVSALSGRVRLGAGIIPATYATVVATDVNGPSSVPVYLQGVTVGIQGESRAWVQAGTTKQFTANVYGSSNTAVAWSVSPATGSINSSGLYTAPGTVASPTDVTVTATSSADSGATASTTVTLMPAGTIRVNAGSFADTSTAEGMWWKDYQQISNCNWAPGDPWPAADPLVNLYPTGIWSYGDLWRQLTVPNGWYKITLTFGQCGGGNPIAAGSWVNDVESQGTVYRSLLDLHSLATAQDAPGSMTFTTQVTNGELYFALRRVIDAGVDTPSGLELRAFKIEPAGIPVTDTRLTGTMRLAGIKVH